MNTTATGTPHRCFARVHGLSPAEFESHQTNKFSSSTDSIAGTSIHVKRIFCATYPNGYILGISNNKHSLGITADGTERLACKSCNNNLFHRSRKFVNCESTTLRTHAKLSQDRMLSTHVRASHKCTSCWKSRSAGNIHSQAPGADFSRDILLLRPE